MTRNLKVLSLAVVAALAMTAVMASAAQATKFTTSASSGTLTATQTSEQVFTTDAGTVRCSTSNQEGAFSSTSFESLEVSASYSGCKAFGFLSATVAMGNCKYKFTGAGQTGGKALADVVCSSGEITVNTFGCVVHVPAQSNLSSVTFTNGAGDVNASANLTGIHYTQTEGCPNGSGTKTNGTLTGGATVKASSGTVQVD
jgi:hypothetical protein